MLGTVTGNAVYSVMVLDNCVCSLEFWGKILVMVSLSMGKVAKLCVNLDKVTHDALCSRLLY